MVHFQTIMGPNDRVGVPQTESNGACPDSYSVIVCTHDLCWGLQEFILSLYLLQRL